MKTVAMIAILMGPWAGVMAQNTDPGTPAPAAPPPAPAMLEASRTDGGTLQKPPPPTAESLYTLPLGDGAEMDGIFVRAVTMESPLQLVNPIAPARYGGTGTDFKREPRRELTGWNFFTIRF